MYTCFVGDILARSPFSRDTGVTALMISSGEIPSFTEVLILDSQMLTKRPVHAGGGCCTDRRCQAPTLERAQDLIGELRAPLLTRRAETW